jgi:hypothetical protein
MPQVVEASESTIAFLVGYLSASADREFGTGRAWTLRGYMDLRAGNGSMQYVHNLEARIRRAWPDGRGRAPSIQNILSATLVGGKELSLSRN